MQAWSARILNDQQRDEMPLFSNEGLARLEKHVGYGVASPYPHLVLDGIFNDAALYEILREWPSPNGAGLETHDDGTYVKKKIGTTWETNFGDRTRRYFAQLGGPGFLKLLEHVTGISGLLPDPYMFGGGLHATASGGRLAMHADYNKHPIFRLDRRLNLLVYLNDGWTEQNQGWLELWDHQMKACVRRVLPTFNRSVIFSTTSVSFHGQPEQIIGPPSLWRKSLALYYFSNGRPEESQLQKSCSEHSTLWQERPLVGF